RRAGCVPALGCRLVDDRADDRRRRGVHDPVTRIHHTGLTVSNLERSLAFWGEALGMQVVMQQDRRGGYFEAIGGEHGVDVRTAQVAFAGEGARIELFEFRSPRGGRAV